jgi:hypothetical protein
MVLLFSIQSSTLKLTYNKVTIEKSVIWGNTMFRKKLDALSEDKKSNKPLYIDLIRITIILFYVRN